VKLGPGTFEIILTVPYYTISYLIDTCKYIDFYVQAKALRNVLENL